jgi:putative FmdB family regulatory protein
MPTYEAKCGPCNAQVEYFRTIANRNTLPTCPLCGGTTHRIVATAPLTLIPESFKAFKSTVDGSIIENYKQLKEHNRRNDVINLNEAYSEDTIQNGDYYELGGQDFKDDPKKDVEEAIKMVKEGYKPQCEEYTENV